MREVFLELDRRPACSFAKQSHLDLTGTQGIVLGEISSMIKEKAGLEKVYLGSYLDNR